ncbi:hypothetical protein D3C79_760450 [compost metagenome]
MRRLVGRPGQPAAALVIKNIHGADPVEPLALDPAWGGGGVEVGRAFQQQVLLAGLEAQALALQARAALGFRHAGAGDPEQLVACRLPVQPAAGQGQALVVQTAHYRAVEATLQGQAEIQHRGFLIGDLQTFANLEPAVDQGGEHDAEYGGKCQSHHQLDQGQPGLPVLHRLDTGLTGIHPPRGSGFTREHRRSRCHAPSCLLRG